MLIRRVITGLATVAVAVAAGLVLGSPRPAYADYVYCPPTGGDCYVVVTGPGGGNPGGGGTGGGTGGGGPSWCPDPYKPTGYGCFSDFWGWYDSADGCGYRLTDPQPPAGDPFWNGAPAGAKAYTKVCPDTLGGPFTVTTVALADPPPGYGGMPSAQQLAAEAINKLALKGPDIQIAPAPNGAGAVGLPVWLSTAVTPTTWGPNSATAAVPGLSVTATARAQHIVWDMGDGHSVTCGSPGTPYNPSYGDRASPDCGYLYTVSSRGQSNGRYSVTGTTTWQITWTATTGETGNLTVTRSSTTSVRIDEVQVVTQ
jgi:hypothetical protein